MFVEDVDPQPGDRPPTGAHTGSALVGRGLQLAEVEAALTRAEGGRGAVVCLAGLPGAGTSAVLEASADRARRRGFTVREAAAGPHQQDYPYGVARQLLGHRAADPSLPDTPEGPAAERAAVERLQEAVQQLVFDAPLLLAVDDITWADPQSLRWLHYLSRCPVTTPVVLLVTRCPAERGAAPGPLADLLARARQVPVPELTGPQVARLAAARGGGGGGGSVGPAPEVLRDAGGNPALLRVLLDARESGPPLPHDAGVRAVEPAVRMVERLRRQSPDAAEYARCLSVLEPAAPRLVGEVAAVAGTDAEPRRVLTAMGVLTADGTRFRHPLLRDGVRALVPDAERARWQAQAAVRLYQQCAPPAEVARRLLAGAPVRLPWVAPLLRRAAADAPPEDTALPVACLRAALEQPLEDTERSQVLCELALAEAGEEPVRALVRLDRALDASTGRADAERLAATAALIVYEAQAPEGVAVLARTARTMFGDACGRPGAPGVDPAPGAVAGLRLLTRGAVANGGSSTRPHGGGAQCPPEDRDEARTSAVRRALALLTAADPAAAAGWPPGWARLGPDAADWEHELLVNALLFTGDTEAALECAQQALEYALRHRAEDDAAAGHVLAARVQLARGEEGRAAGHARIAMDAVLECHGQRARAPWALRSLAVWTELEVRGDRPESARAMLERLRSAGRLPSTAGALALRLARGGLLLAEGSPQEALAELLDCGRRLSSVHPAHRPVLRWRAPAARALRALGRAEEAAACEREDLDAGSAAGAHLGAGGPTPLVPRGRSGEGRTPGMVGHGWALTAHERRVAELAANGLSNREIAERLTVTQRTVEFHLTNVYRKLGISRRTQLHASLGGGPVAAERPAVRRPPWSAVPADAPAGPGLRMAARGRSVLPRPVPARPRRAAG
ncbi:LuxR C-terminal-related transcriptional regulator [Kitasatospora sp. NPDC052868]|uniref:helix-turn-helix transcriptional regulator n=1 Tax=Kitasatospora sp. NPDC052868 TaxID=3364060 RepID=UPI0037CB4F92